MNTTTVRRGRLLAVPALFILLAGCGQSAPATVEARRAPQHVACDANSFDVLGGLDLQTATVLDVQAALDRHAFTSEDLVNHQLALIGAFSAAGPALNAIRALAPSALRQARDADQRRNSGHKRGPLDGVTVLLKDNIGTTDMPTTAGSIALATNVPLREATLTRRLRDAGAIVLGKTNLSEFANWMATGMMPNGYSSLGGQVLAPYTFAPGTFSDPSGSSSGSGVSGTMGFTTVAIGTETSGSIIGPSEANSLVGVKPTLGLVSRIGVIPLAPSFDTPGPMARTVTDAALLLQALAYADAEDPASARFTQALGGQAPDYLAALSPTALRGARIGVRQVDGSPYGETWNGADVQIYLHALDVLKAQGAELVTINDPLFAADEFVPLTELGALFNEFKISLNQYLANESGPDTFVETLSDIIAYNSQYPDKIKYGQYNLQVSDAQSGTEMDPVYVASREAAIQFSQNYIDQVMAFYDLDAIVGWDFTTNINVTAAAGYPNVTVPMGYSDSNHQPRGLEFAARPFEEAKLLGFAYAYEQASHARQAPPQVNPLLLSGCQH